MSQRYLCVWFNARKKFNARSKKVQRLVFFLNTVYREVVSKSGGSGSRQLLGTGINCVYSSVARTFNYTDAYTQLTPIPSSC